jgi:hypothetical protein
MRTWPGASNPSIERSLCNPVITGEGDQLFDGAIRVVPELDGIRKVELASPGHTRSSA